MNKCPVCEGVGFVRAAPISVATGALRVVGARQGKHRKAVWRHAVTIPCWACSGGNDAEETT